MIKLNYSDYALRLKEDVNATNEHFTSIWKRKRFQEVTLGGPWLANGLYIVITMKIMSIIPLTPHYVLSHELYRMYTVYTISGDNTQLHLLEHQLAVYNLTIMFIIAALAGAWCGLLLEKTKAYLASLISVTFFWLNAIVALVCYIPNGAMSFPYPSNRMVIISDNNIVLWIAVLLLITATAIASSFTVHFIKSRVQSGDTPS